MLVWRPERIQQQYEFEPFRKNHSKRYWITLVFRRNEKRRRSVYFADLQNPVDVCRSIFGAGNETRTRDPDLGKVVLYQLSYSRLVMRIL